MSLHSAARYSNSTPRLFSDALPLTAFVRGRKTEESVGFTVNIPKLLDLSTRKGVLVLYALFPLP